MWKQLSLALFLSIVALSSVANAAIVTKTNSTTGTANNTEISRQVTFTAGDFSPDGTTIVDVNLSINFAKSNDTSFVPENGTPNGGTPFFNEIEFTLQSPNGTLFTLISNSGGLINTGTTPNPLGVPQERVGADNGPSFAQGSGPFQGRINFDQQASTAVNSDPNTIPNSNITGLSYRPDDNTANSLDIYNGQDAVGTWTLYIETDAAGDVLSFYDYSITIQSVPEPTSMVMLGVCASAAALGVYRRKRAKAKQPAIAPAVA